MLSAILSLFGVLLAVTGLLAFVYVVAMCVWLVVRPVGAGAAAAARTGAGWARTLAGTLSGVLSRLSASYGPAESYRRGEW